MRRLEQIAIAIILVVLSVGFWVWTAHRTKPTQSTSQSSLPLILQKGEIRCSYLLYSPYFRKDPNTGQLSGIFHDLMEEIGKRSNLKIIWVEEVGYENIFPGLDAGRYDVFAGGLWPNTTRARAGSFTVPVFYSTITGWARADETRFVDLKGIDEPDVRIATIDGAMEDIIAKNDYPNATRVSLPQLSPFTQNLLNIKTKKADITFAEPSIVHEFLVQNPGSLKEIAPEQPLRTFGNTLVIRRGDTQLKEFLDISLSELLNSGVVDRILRQYEATPGSFPRVAVPYQLYVSTPTEHVDPAVRH